MPPRISALEPPYEPSVAEDLTMMMPPGVAPIALFRTVARNPRVLRKLRLSNLLDRGSITLREREIVILRACARCGSDYEWGIHVATFSSKAKLSDAQVAATAHAAIDPALWSEAEVSLLRLVDELHDSQRVSGALYETLARTFSPMQLVELVTLTGLYHSISFLTNAFLIEPEAGAPRLPVLQP